MLTLSHYSCRFTAAARRQAEIHTSENFHKKFIAKIIFKPELLARFSSSKQEFYSFEDVYFCSFECNTRDNGCFCFKVLLCESCSFLRIALCGKTRLLIVLGVLTILILCLQLANCSSFEGKFRDVTLYPERDLTFSLCRYCPQSRLEDNWCDRVAFVYET